MAATKKKTGKKNNGMPARPPTKKKSRKGR